MLAALQNLQRAPYFDNYLQWVKSEDLRTELTSSMDEFTTFVKSLDESDLDMRYAPEKWTIREVILHVIECELIFAFRALTIAREDREITLAGFDENDYIQAMGQDPYGVNELADYFEAMRRVTLFLLQSMNKSQLQKVGVASGHNAQVSALFYVISGHGRHHQKVIESKYLLR